MQTRIVLCLAAVALFSSSIQANTIWNIANYENDQNGSTLSGTFEIDDNLQIVSATVNLNISGNGSVLLEGFEQYGDDFSADGTLLIQDGSLVLDQANGPSQYFPAVVFYDLGSQAEVFFGASGPVGDSTYGAFWAYDTNGNELWFVNLETTQDPSSPSPDGTGHIGNAPMIVGVSIVPEPASLSLLALGGLLFMRRRRGAR